MRPIGWRRRPTWPPGTAAIGDMETLRSMLPVTAAARIHIGDPVLVNDEPYVVRRVTDVPDSDAIVLVIGPPK